MQASSDTKAWLVTSILDASLMLKLITALEDHSIEILGVNDKISELAIDLDGNIYS